MGRLAADRDLAALLPLLGHRNVQVREEARTALLGLASEDADPFIALLRTGSPDLQRHSAEVLAAVPGLDPARLIAALGHGDASPALITLVAEQQERVLPDLLGALGSAREELRDDAVLALARMGPSAWPALVVRLRDPSRRVRGAAARALEGSGWEPAGEPEVVAHLVALEDWDAVARKGSVAVPALVEVLGDRHPDVREGAVGSLGQSGSQASVAPLLDRLVHDPEEEVRAAAARALGHLADPRATPQLRLALHDRSRMVRRAAATALVALGSEPGNEDERVVFLIATERWPDLVALGSAAVPGLIRTLGDHSYEVRRGAGGALLRLGPEARPALERARTDPDHSIRDEVAAILSRLGPARAGNAGDTIPSSIHQEMAEPEPDRAMAPMTEEGVAASTVAEAAPPVEFATLVGTLYGGSPGDRVTAAAALGSMPPDRAVPALAGVLCDPDPVLRTAATVTLGALGVAAMPLLVDRLADPDDGVRSAAIGALARAGPTAVPALVAALGRPERDVRAAAAHLLAQSGQEESPELAIAAEHWGSLARHGDAAIEPLARLLSHPDPELRLGAVIALGGIRGEAVDVLLRQASADPSPVVRNRATLLLNLRRTDAPQRV